MHARTDVSVKLLFKASEQSEFSFVETMTSDRINIDQPLWDQSSFTGRFQYFAWMSNPMNGLVGNQTLLEAKQLLQAYREGKEPPGTTESQVDTYNICSMIFLVPVVDKEQSLMSEKLPTHFHYFNS